MSTALAVYKFVVILMLLCAIPVAFDCVWDICNRKESTHNRRAAALWIPVMVLASLLWPLLVIFAAFELRQSWRERRAGGLTCR